MQICDKVQHAAEAESAASGVTPADGVKPTPTSWVELFEPVDFFGMYKTYVQVIASASSADKIKDW
jgi:poly(A) polymerase Pap1